MNADTAEITMSSANRKCDTYVSHYNYKKIMNFLNKNNTK